MCLRNSDQGGTDDGVQHPAEIHPYPRAPRRLVIGLGTGYLVWGWPHDSYRVDLAKLPTGPEISLVREGSELVVDTARYIGGATKIRPNVSPATTWPA